MSFARSIGVLLWMREEVDIIDMERTQNQKPLSEKSKNQKKPAPATPDATRCVCVRARVWVDAAALLARTGSTNNLLRSGCCVLFLRAAAGDEMEG
jgi:hypothetical protein